MKIKMTSSQAFELQAHKFGEILDQLNKQTEVWIELKNNIVKGMIGVLIGQFFSTLLILTILLKLINL